MSVSGKQGRWGLSFSLGVEPGLHARRSSEPQPLKILIAADFSGRGAAGGREEPVSTRRPRRVDVDTLDAVFASFEASVVLPVSVGRGEFPTLTPRRLDDLHPDELLRAVPELAEIVELKQALAVDPSAGPRLAQVLGRPGRTPSGAEGSPEGSDVEPPSGVRQSGESSDQMLSRLLGGSVDDTAVHRAVPAGAFDVDQLVRSIVGGLSQAPEAPEDTTALASAAEHALGERLRDVLRAPGFRQLERTWRALDGLVRQCPDEQIVQYFVLDATAEDLANDPEALRRLLEPGFSLLLADHLFGADASTLEGLASVLRICTERGVTLLGAAHPELIGCPGFDRAPDPEQWTLEQSPAARAAWEALVQLRQGGSKLLLALPRFLLRQPYGSAGETLETLRFEEILDAADHEAFAWGNGAYLLVRAIAELKASAGERAHPDGSIVLRELPVVHLESAEGIQIKPCAEAWLSDRALGRLLAAGFSVLHGQRDSDRVRVYL